MVNTTIDESWIDPIFDAVVSDIQRSGYFDMVNEHEPRTKPGMELRAAVWIQHITPLGTASGLSETSGRILFNVRMYSNLRMQPPDLIDPNLAKACSNTMRRYHDDFDFGLDPLVRHVDLLGAYDGVGLYAQAGYLEQDSEVFRIMDLRVPVIVNDIWSQVP
jgi:hypothetical protein